MYRRYVFFVVASLALFMMSVDSTIVATALATIQRGMKANLSWTGWVITAYQLTAMTVMPLMGRISDEWGRKRVFLACVTIFTTGSLLCALSPNIYWLIAARALQALGGGGFMPSAVGIVGDHFAEERARAVGLFTSIFPLGGLIGPALGGWILDLAGWQAIFLVNLPIGVLVLVLSHFLLEPDPEVQRTHLDLAGAGLFALSVLSVMYFMTRLGEDPAAASSWVTWLVLATSAFFLAAFLRREARASTPVLEVALLKNRAFAVINILNFLYGACVFGLLAFIPYYAQVAYGLSNLASGSLLTARAVGMMGMATVTSMSLKRTGYRLPMAAGFLVLAASTLGLSSSWHLQGVFGRRIADFWWLFALVAVSGVGVGLASPSSNNAALELMPDKIAAITGLRGMFRQTGGVIGTSAIVLVLSRFPDRVAGFHVVFLGVTAVLVLATLLIRGVPDGRAGASLTANPPLQAEPEAAAGAKDRAQELGRRQGPGISKPGRRDTMP